MTRGFRLVLPVLLFCGGLQAAKVSSIFKEPVDGEVAKLDIQGRLEVRVPGSEVPERIPLDEVEEISFENTAVERKPEETPLRVVLTNGDLLYGAPLNGPEGEDELFRLVNPRFGEIELDILQIKRIEVVANVKPNVLPELEDEAEYDSAWFTSESKPDPRAELVRVTKEGAYLYNELLDGDNYEGNLFTWTRLRGVVCNRDLAEPMKGLMGIFTLRDGSILRGEIKSWGGGKIELKHETLGRALALEERNLMQAVMKNGRYVYLSDLEFGETPEERPYYLPADFKYDEYLFKVRRDQAQGGGPLSIRGRTYAKGFGVHAISKLTFNLHRGYSRLVASIGVDDSAGDLASVEFKIYGDGKLLYSSGVMRRTSPAKEIDLEILNVNRLVLEVTASDNADVQDRANWANIKVVR